jgi:F-type H+-transporting ATPase subunit delta
VKRLGKIMAAHSDEQLTLAKVYASSILAVAKEKNDVEGLGQELREFGKIVDSQPDVWAYLSSPTVEASKRAGSLEKMLRGRAKDLLVDSLQIVNRNGRLHLLPAIVHAYAALQEELAGRVEVQVRTASQLKPQQEQRIRDIIRKHTGKEADLVIDVDPSLIGGLVVQIGDEKLDSSVSRKLEKMHEILMERGSREVQRIDSYIDELTATR